MSGRDDQYRSAWALLEIYLSLGKRIYFRMGRVRSRFLILTVVFVLFFLEQSPSPLTFGSWFFLPKGRGAVRRGRALDPPCVIPESPHYQAVPGIPRAATDLETTKQMKKATLARDQGPDSPQLTPPPPSSVLACRKGIQ